MTESIDRLIARNYLKDCRPEKMGLPPLTIITCLDSSLEKTYSSFGIDFIKYQKDGRVEETWWYHDINYHIPFFIPTGCYVAIEMINKDDPDFDLYSIAGLEAAKVKCIVHPDSLLNYVVTNVKQQKKNMKNAKTASIKKPKV